jgi:hypothetical protein
MPVAQSPAHYINISKGCPSITESFPLVGFLVLCANRRGIAIANPIRATVVSLSGFGQKSCVISNYFIHYSCTLKL